MTTKIKFALEDYLDIDELIELVEAGFVTERKHQELPLTIYNYTPRATYSFRPAEWSETLSKCRGLIVDDQGYIVAIAQPKFWNLDPENHDEIGQFVAFDKLDGSLGIVYQYGDHVGVATRGSFHSTQADWANAFLSEHPEYVEYFKSRIELGKTPHVEIIFKDNRIVLDYDYEDLVFLGEQAAIYYDGWQTGWLTPTDLTYEEYPGRVAEQFYANSWREFFEQARPNSEGYVIHYLNSGNKYKIKHDWYVELHKLIFNLTPRNIWEQLVASKFYQFILDLPEEFREEAEAIGRDLKWKFYTNRRAIWNTYREINEPGISRKDFAAKVAELPPGIRPYMFLLFDGHSRQSVDRLWQELKP